MFVIVNYVLCRPDKIFVLLTGMVCICTNTHVMSLFGIFAYLLTSIWVLFNWFYLRPKQIKQQSNLDEISKLEMLIEQLDEKIRHPHSYFMLVEI
jgi:hypothetical protein